ncbi:MAG: hypothetical protein DMG68_21775, partial [Acidobacteria bacterium]
LSLAHCRNGDQKRCPLPDFAAIRKEIFRDRILPGSDLLIEERGRFSGPASRKSHFLSRDLHKWSATNILSLRHS